ncbi:unnamed protein product, partial [Didymodactylos carnosus]
PVANQALEKLVTLQSIYNIPFLFLTNGGGILEHLKSEKLQKIFSVLKNKISEENFILSHTPWKLISNMYKEKMCMYLCRNKRFGEEIMKNYGFIKIIYFDDYCEKVKFLLPSKYKQNLEVKKLRDQILSDKNLQVKIDSIFVLESPADWQSALQI